MYIFVLFCIIFILLLSMGYACLIGAPWVPTRSTDVARVLVLFEPKAGQKIYELGCGDGRISMALARASEADVIGVEISLPMWLYCRFQNAVYRVKNARFIFANAYTVDISGADGVFIFIMPRVYEKLRVKFEKELKPGARVVSCVWPIPGWKAAVVDKKDGQYDLFLYIIGQT